MMPIDADFDPESAARRLAENSHFRRAEIRAGQLVLTVRAVHWSVRMTLGGLLGLVVGGVLSSLFKGLGEVGFEVFFGLASGVGGLLAMVGSLKIAEEQHRARTPVRPVRRRLTIDLPTMVRGYRQWSAVGEASAERTLRIDKAAYFVSEVVGVVVIESRVKDEDDNMYESALMVRDDVYLITPHSLDREGTRVVAQEVAHLCGFDQPVGLLTIRTELIQVQLVGAHLFAGVCLTMAGILVPREVELSAQAIYWMGILLGFFLSYLMVRAWGGVRIEDEAERVRRRLRKRVKPWPYAPPQEQR